MTPGQEAHTAKTNTKPNVTCNQLTGTSQGNAAFKQFMTLVPVWCDGQVLNQAHEQSVFRSAKRPNAGSFEENGASAMTVAMTEGGADSQQTERPAMLMAQRKALEIEGGSPQQP